MGIPSNNSSDPRNGANKNAEYNAGSGGTISQWPEELGLAATFDPSITKNFGSIASKEYRALGITTALSPQIDLATEPRWNRFVGTFGEDPNLATDMSRAYVDGFQTSPTSIEKYNGWGNYSVNAMVKHWPGGGPEEAGRDGHFAYGKFAVYPGNNFQTHLRTFINGAFKLEGSTKKAAAVMPYYTISVNQDIKNPKVLILGVAYKPGVGDVRETPVSELRDYLKAKGADVAWHDPLVPVWEGSNPVDLDWTCDVAILATMQPGMNLVEDPKPRLGQHPCWHQ